MKMARMLSRSKNVKARATTATPAPAKAKTRNAPSCSYAGSFPLSRLFNPHPKYNKKCDKPAGFEVKTKWGDGADIWVPICQSHAKMWRAEDIRPIVREDNK